MIESLDNNEMIALVPISLVTIEDVKEFNRVAESMPCNVTLVSNSFRINGKSLFGIFSLDTTMNTYLEINEKYKAYFRKWIKE